MEVGVDVEVRPSFPEGAPGTASRAHRPVLPFSTEGCVEPDGRYAGQQRAPPTALMGVVCEILLESRYNPTTKYSPHPTPQVPPIAVAKCAVMIVTELEYERRNDSSERVADMIIWEPREICR